MSAETISLSLSETPNVHIVKSKFTSLQSNLYGLVIIIADKYGKRETINGIVSTYSDVHDLELHSSWKEFQDSILGFKMGGRHNDNLSGNIVGEFHKLFTDHKTATEFYDAVNNYNYKKLDQLIDNIIYKVLNEKKPIIESSIEDITQEEYLSTLNKTNTPSNFSNIDLQDISKNSIPHSITLSVQPILSPIIGKAVYELKIGDKIMVKIIPTSDQNRYIEMFGLRQGNEVMPMPSDVVDIKAGRTRKDPIAITVRMAKNIYGYFTEEESHVRLKMFDPDADLSHKKIYASQVKSTVMPTVLAIFLLIIIVIFIIIQI